MGFTHPHCALSWARTDVAVVLLVTSESSVSLTPHNCPTTETALGHITVLDSGCKSVVQPCLKSANSQNPKQTDHCDEVNGDKFKTASRVTHGRLFNSHGTLQRDWRGGSCPKPSFWIPGTFHSRPQSPLGAQIPLQWGPYGDFCGPGKDTYDPFHSRV